MPQHSYLHPCEWQSSPWEYIHVDFAGLFQGLLFFIMVDTHSNWPDASIIKSTTATYTIQLMQEIFTYHEIPLQLLSDNSPQFTSEEFATFIRENGIRHICLVPFHAATNRLAERFVQTLKHSFKAMGQSISPEKKLLNLLLMHRNTPHATTVQAQCNETKC